MDHHALRKLLNEVKADKVSVERAIELLRHLPFEDLGFAKVDHHRAIRCGFPEVIYCEGKTTEQVVRIFERRKSGGGNVLATRAAPEVSRAVRRRYSRARYNELARTITLRQDREKPTDRFVAVVCAGTSDMPVAEEARETLEIMNQGVRTFYDVGVAGIHRVLVHVEELSEAVAVVVCAGMEGALPSVVGGLVASPVIAVPTSVGYGAHFGGLAPLLTMLNSCATGVSVVNIDNGFGAGYLAALIGRVAEDAAASATRPSIAGSKADPRRKASRARRPAASKRATTKKKSAR